MTLAVRVIPCLDVDAGRVVKGVNFVDLRDAGDPAEEDDVAPEPVLDRLRQGTGRPARLGPADVLVVDDVLRGVHHGGHRRPGGRQPPRRPGAHAGDQLGVAGRGAQAVLHAV